MSDDDEIILSELDDDELVQQMHDDLYDGLQEEVVEGVNILLGRGWTPRCTTWAAWAGAARPTDAPAMTTRPTKKRTNFFMSR